MRPNGRVLVIAAAIGFGAGSSVPALAADADGGQVEARFGVAKIGDWAKRARIAQRAEGPFVPVVGKADYGTAENAFGAARSGHVHAGQDMFAPAGTPLVAVSDAVVIDVGSDGGQGNYVHLFDRKRERTYVYMHMIEPATVSAGDRIAAGERVGGVGCTGSCWGDHLHFEVREGRGFTAEAIDPLAMIRDWRSLERPAGG